MSVDINSPNAVPPTSAPQSPLQRLTSLFVQLFERYTPDPYILAVGLTILTGILAAVLAPKGSVSTILSGWYTYRSRGSRITCLSSRDGNGCRLRRAGRRYDPAVLGVTRGCGCWDQYSASDGIHRDELSSRYRAIWHCIPDLCLTLKGLW
jgi:hypothetical protein